MPNFLVNDSHHFSTIDLIGSALSSFVLTIYDFATCKCIIWVFFSSTLSSSEVTFKDPSVLWQSSNACGLLLHPTSVLGRGWLVYVFCVSLPYPRQGDLRFKIQGHLAQWRRTSVLACLLSSDIKAINSKGESTSLRAIILHVLIDYWLVNQHATVV